MENLSLFGEVEHGKMLDKDLRAGELLDVVRMEFVEADTLLDGKTSFLDLIHSAPLHTHLP